MALPLRSDSTGERKAPVVRSRAHGNAVALRNADGALTRRTRDLTHAVARPVLTVVPRRRRTARLVAAGSVVVFGLMIGAAAFQTQIARRQVQLDSMDTQIKAARLQYDDLRRHRAELRSPGRLATEAAALGMVPATQTKFIRVAASEYATVQQTGVRSAAQQRVTIQDEFSTYTQVKAQAGGAP